MVVRLLRLPAPPKKPPTIGRGIVVEQNTHAVETDTVEEPVTAVTIGTGIVVGQKIVVARALETHTVDQPVLVFTRGLVTFQATFIGNLGSNTGIGDDKPWISAWALSGHVPPSATPCPFQPTEGEGITIHAFDDAEKPPGAWPDINPPIKHTPGSLTRRRGDGLFETSCPAFPGALGAPAFLNRNNTLIGLCTHVEGCPDIQRVVVTPIGQICALLQQHQILPLEWSFS